MKSIFSLPGSSPRSDDQVGHPVSKKLIKEKPSDAEKSQELKDSGNGEKVAEGESEQPEDKPEVKLKDDQSKEEPPVGDDGKAEAGNSGLELEVLSQTGNEAEPQNDDIEMSDAELSKVDADEGSAPTGEESAAVEASAEVKKAEDESVESEVKDESAGEVDSSVKDTDAKESAFDDGLELAKVAPLEETEVPDVDLEEADATEDSAQETDTSSIELEVITSTSVEAEPSKTEPEISNLTEEVVDVSETSQPELCEIEERRKSIEPVSADLNEDTVDEAAGDVASDQVVEQEPPTPAIGTFHLHIIRERIAP